MFTLKCAQSRTKRWTLAPGSWSFSVWTSSPRPTNSWTTIAKTKWKASSAFDATWTRASMRTVVSGDTSNNLSRTINTNLTKCATVAMNEKVSVHWILANTHRFLLLAEFMSYSPCLSESGLIRSATQCTELFHDRLLYIAQFVSDENKISAACCSLHKRHDCLSQSVFSSAQCELDAQNFVTDHVQQPFRHIVQSICAPHYLSESNCARRIPPLLWQHLFNDTDYLQAKLTSAKRAYIAQHAHHHEEQQQQRHHRQSNHSDLVADDDDTPPPPTLHNTPPLNPEQLVKMKFQESFLAMLFIIKHTEKWTNSQSQHIEPIYLHTRCINFKI